MKVFVQTVTFLTAVVLLSTALAAQTPVMVRADIPFAFQFGGREYPAGQYFFSSNANNRLILRDSDSNLLGSASFHPARDIESHNTPSLKFRTTAGKHVLAEVWQAGSDGGFRLTSPRKGSQAQAVVIADTGGRENSPAAVSLGNRHDDK
jgi:hypothetical protein